MKKQIISIIAGSLLTLSLAPFHLAFLALIAPALLCYCLLGTTIKRAAALGLLFGIGFFGTSTYWVYISIHTFGYLNIFLAATITALFILVLSLYFVFQSMVFAAIVNFKYRKNKTTYPKTPKEIINNSPFILLFFPCLWLIFEVLRATLFTGFAWNLLGYSQIATPLAGLAPIIGVYGVGFITCLTSIILLIAFCSKGYRCLNCFLIFLLIIAAGQLLKQINWTHKAGKAISVSLIQGNIPQSIKWDPNQAITSINTYNQLIHQNIKAHLIVLPENAIPLFYQQAKNYIDSLNKLAKANKSTIVMGLPYYTPDNKYYNAAMAIGAGNGLYLKKHLVPFGEYIPLTRYIGHFLQFMNIPMSNFSKGPIKQKLLRIGKYKAAIFICFESAFSTEVLKQLHDANFIITICDDAWFGNSIASAQHEQIEQMRALETGRYIVRATNNGITSIIAPNGKIIKSVPKFIRTVLNGKIYPMAGKTLYSMIYSC